MKRILFALALLPSLAGAVTSGISAQPVAGGILSVNTMDVAAPLDNSNLPALSAAVGQIDNASQKLHQDIVSLGQSIQRNWTVPIQGTNTQVILDANTQAQIQNNYQNDKAALQAVLDNLP